MVKQKNMIIIKKRTKTPERIYDMLRVLDKSRPGEIVAAQVNEQLVDLHYEVNFPCTIKMIDKYSPTGMEVYRRSGLHILYQAVYRLFGTHAISIGQSIGSNYFIEFRDDRKLTQTAITNIKLEIKRIVDDAQPFTHRRRSIVGAQELFQKMGLMQKSKLLRFSLTTETLLVGNSDYMDIYHGPYLYDASWFNEFDIQIYPPGFLIKFPDRMTKKVSKKVIKRRKLFNVFKERRAQLIKSGTPTVVEMNQAIIDGNIGEIIKVSEGYHEKQIALIADNISKKKGCRCVLISGPSSSGKTTFLKRLAIQLRVNDITPISMSLDDYFVDRDKTPRDENGDFDFEHIQSLDLPLINKHLKMLMAGKEVNVPTYSFKLGKRKIDPNKVRQLQKGDILLIEGIHGLNPMLSKSIPDKHKFKLYVSALTQLSIDYQNRIYTSTSRLMRRMVRDKRYRGYNAEMTLEIWPRVQRGEERNIFPFQEEADIIFNSALPYEIFALKFFAERYLREVGPESEYFTEAVRLIHFLAPFVPIFPDEIPANSIIREFIGGSSFEY